MAAKKFKKLTVTFKDSNDAETLLEYNLIDSPATQAWVRHISSAVNDDNLIHLGVATLPTEERIKRHWDIVRYFTYQANLDHLLDEWIHLPEVLDLESDYQILFNKIRSRCQAYEMYANYNNQRSDTRTNLARVSRAIDIFEQVIRTAQNDPRIAVWFKSKINYTDTRTFTANKYLNDSVSYGDLVMLSPGVSRTLNEARLADDSELLRRNMIMPWVPSSVTMIAFSDYAEDLTATDKWIDKLGYNSKYMASPSFCKVGQLATDITKEDIVELLKTAKVNRLELI